MILSRKLDQKELDRLHDTARERLGVKSADVGIVSIGRNCIIEKKADSSRLPSYEIEGLINTGAVDLDREVVVPSGADWKLFGPDGAKQFKCIYMHHDLTPGSIVAVARSVKRSKFPDGWTIRAKMMGAEYGEPAKQAIMLAQEGALGFSVQFAATDRGPPTADEKSMYPGAKSIVRKWTPFEVSVTPMRCNLDCGTATLWMDDQSAKSVDDLIRKGLAPEWASKRFVRPARRVVVCRV